jgi:hypothetical protein
MSDDYLWNKQGKPPKDVAKLESVLGRLRYEKPSRAHRGQRFRRWGLRRLVPLAIAAVALLALAIFWPTSEPPSPALEVSPLAHCAAAACTRGKLQVGEWLETDEGASARVHVAQFGYLDVAPKTRLRLKTSRATEQRLELARGRVSAQVSAPPRLLIVETPSAVAVDLGCAYTLDVDAAGNGLLRVTTGYVALELPGRSAFVPAGAECESRVGKGIGTPRFADAPAPLRAALRRLDFDGPSDEALGVVMKSARAKDTLSLWNLLSAVSAAQRPLVYDRIVRLAHAPPEPITREAVLALDPKALEEWRETLEPLW